MNLKKYRENSGLSQRELAEKAGVHITAIGKLESGERSFGKLRLETALKIADALSADVRSLIDEEN